VVDFIFIRGSCQQDENIAPGGTDQVTERTGEPGSHADRVRLPHKAASEGWLVRRREFVTLVGVAATWPLAALAQEAGRVYRIGVLSGLARTIHSHEPN